MLKLGDQYSLRETAFVLALGLVFGALMNLDALHGWSRRLPHGPFREWAVSWTKAPATIYREASLDSPKRWLGDLLKSLRYDFRAKNPDKGPGDLESKPDGEPAAAKSLVVAPQQAEKQSKSPRESEKQVLIMGDSMMVGALGRVLEAEFAGSSMRPLRRARISTGLARPDYFNWEDEVKRIYAENAVDLAIVMLGGNDTQDIKAGKRRIAFGTKTWAKVYKERLARVLGPMCEAKTKVIWLGAPPMKLAKYNYNMMWLNKVVQEGVRPHGCARFFPTVALFSNKDGSYASYGNVSGRYRQIRMADGIHLTRSGGHLLADALLSDLKIERKSKPSE